MELAMCDQFCATALPRMQEVCRSVGAEADLELATAATERKQHLQDHLVRECSRAVAQKCPCRCWHDAAI